MMQGAEGTNDSRTLDFGDGDESLPWLESGEEETQTGFDTTRLIGIALLMVVALGVIVGAIWWFTNSTAAGGPEPDGSLVEAPDEPYRSRPEDAGGKTFAGTGDTSFAVGEGQTREGCGRRVAHLAAADRRAVGRRLSHRRRSRRYRHRLPASGGGRRQCRCASPLQRASVRRTALPSQIGPSQIGLSQIAEGQARPVHTDASDDACGRGAKLRFFRL